MSAKGSRRSARQKFLQPSLDEDDGRGRSRSMNRRYKWQYWSKASRAWVLFSHDVNLALDRAKNKGTETSWVRREEDIYMQIDFKSMKIKYQDRECRWIQAKIRKRDDSSQIPDKVIMKRLALANNHNKSGAKEDTKDDDKKSGDTGDVKSPDDKRTGGKAAEVPPHRTLFRAEATTGLSVPVIQPLSQVGWSGTLLITAIRGRYLHEAKKKQDVYVEFGILSNDKHRRRTLGKTPKCKEGGSDPIFNHTLSGRISCEDRVLGVTVWSKGTMQDSIIGRFKISLPLIVAYLNPVAAAFSGTTTADVIQRRKDAAKKITSKYPTIVPQINGKVTFEQHNARMVRCGQYTLRSWFILTRDFHSPFASGEVLLDFRFFPSAMSKIVDWSLMREPTNPILRSGKIFGVSLKDAINKSEYVVPAPVVECVEYLIEFGLYEEGLFRVPGDSNVVKSIKTSYDKHEEVSIPGVHEAAGVLKLYFREMADSLIPSRLYRAFLDVSGTANIEEKIEKYKYVVSMLPEENSLVLHYLVHFLVMVVRYSQINKMEEKNLAIVWAPNLLRSPNASGPDLGSIPQQITCIQTFIVYFKEIFHAATLGRKTRQLSALKSPLKSDARKKPISPSINVDPPREDAKNKKLNLRDALRMDLKSATKKPLRKAKGRKGRPGRTAPFQPDQTPSPTKAPNSNQSNQPALSARANNAEESSDSVPSPPPEDVGQEAERFAAMLGKHDGKHEGKHDQETAAPEANFLTSTKTNLEPPEERNSGSTGGSDVDSVFNTSMDMSPTEPRDSPVDPSLEARPSMD